MLYTLKGELALGCFAGFALIWKRKMLQILFICSGWVVGADALPVRVKFAMAKLMVYCFALNGKALL